MGIKGLNRLISDNAPEAIRSSEIKNFFGRKVAIDASMCLYQYLIAVRQADGQQLMNQDGNTTSHLSGFFYRTIRMVENGIKPVYVFDGKPPDLKAGELEKRKTRRDEAIKMGEQIKDTGTMEEIKKFEKRTVRATREQNEEAKKLLKLMGIPFINAPCEAEAQCATLARDGKVYAAASEDMDTLCYQPTYLLRHLTYSEARKIPIDEVNAGVAISDLGLTRESFIDLCILLGCDYCETIRGIGPVTAFKLIKKHQNLDNIIEFIKKDEKLSKKYIIPDNWIYKQARELFLNPEVINSDEINLKWEEPDLSGLVDYMCKENGFAEDRIKNGAEKLKKSLKTGVQGRLDTFFKVIPKTDAQKKASLDKKRKSNSNDKKNNSKKTKTSFRRKK
ncbi:multifunctional nuclease RAD27 [Ascoidea rubescens DSM 1968]|uniref:Flap endonuclease 1 n=1 Tax=Ascoidea rubescens DSM 1968 TaxID=1344418 RepID=A0A1D2VFQ6_9ASCO|nr:flap endonuclease 1 [Ascoidea rubescens DSM 1968]ODV60508.1 flap endonuclease 1 [Ascoidea rubescens DSM 1968]